MGEIAINVVKWAAKIGFWAGAVFAFLAVFTFLVSTIQVVANQTVIGELMGIVQIWLPFDLNVVMTWLLTAGLLFLTYRIALIGMRFAQGLINNA